jgi:hypothetical protein
MYGSFRRLSWSGPDNLQCYCSLERTSVESSIDNPKSAPTEFTLDCIAVSEHVTCVKERLTCDCLRKR